MKDEDKTKSQLIAELQEMRKRVAALTQSLEDMEGIASEDMSSLSEPAYQNSQQDRFISERRRIEERLKLTQFCFDNADIGIFQITTNGRIFNANTYAAKMLGYTTEELINLSLSDINPFVSADTLSEDIDRITAPGRINFETVHIKKDGSRIPVGITSNRFEYNDQEYSVAFVQDITERKHDEASLHLAKAIFDKAPIGIWRMGPNGEILDVNDKGCTSIGYSREELLRMKVFDFAPGFTQEHWAENTKILNEAEIKTTESFHQNKSGKIIPIQVIENLLRFEKQEFLVAFVQDITVRKQMEQDLRESQQNLASLIHNVQDGIVRIDKKFRHIFVNPALLKLLNLSVEQYLGKTNKEIGFPEEFCSFWQEKHERVFRSGKSEVCEFDFISANKEKRVYQVILSPERNKNQDVETIVAIVRDITDFKRAEAEKNRIIDELEKTLSEVKTLRGLIPICSRCKKIRDDKGYWNLLESYIEKYSPATFSHSLCPECSDKIYGDQEWYIKRKKKKGKD